MGTSVGRSLHKLSATQVQKVKTPGYYGDGGGLWLQVSPALTKSWVFRFTLNKKPREMGLGPLHTISLTEARGKALANRKLLLEGIDPIEARKAHFLTAAAAAAKIMTFDQCAEAYIEAHRAGWRNPKHQDQWKNTLDTYASPHFGKLAVSAVDTGLVMKALQPIWTTKTETASRLRGRIESVLASATVNGYRSGDNPARWRGHLDQLLPEPTKVAKVENHPALPYAEVGAFMRELRSQLGTSPALLEFIILTAVRTSEAVGATWREIDLDEQAWTIPGERMKAGREHRAPLSDAAVRILKRMEDIRSSEYVFPGAKENQPLSNMACLTLLKRMGRSDITVHGFRSTFRDWAAEQTNFPREVAEMALAHTIENKVEAAYRRGDLFEKRAKLMQAWADYCGRAQKPGKVVPIGRKAEAA